MNQEQMKHINHSSHRSGESYELCSSWRAHETARHRYNR